MLGSSAHLSDLCITGDLATSVVVQSNASSSLVACNVSGTKSNADKCFNQKVVGTYHVY